MPEETKLFGVWEECKTKDIVFGEVIHGLECEIYMEPRPGYCDRGNWVAKLDAFGDLALDIDRQDGWPRYYMSLERGKLEVEDWLKKRRQLP